jgi:dipeptidyl aminopeptidase/acylaminoacyl peptidase
MNRPESVVVPRTARAPRAARAPLLVTLLCAALASGAASAAAAPAPLTVEDVARLRQVPAADLSHDGRLAAFVREVPRAADEPNGSAWRHLYVQPLAGGPARPFVTGQVRVDAPAFSPDDRLVAFVAKRGEQKHAQVWAIPVDGGEARPLTDHPQSVESFAWLPDGGRLVYVATAARPKREETLREKGYAPDVFEEDLRDHALWLAPVDFAGEPARGRRLTEGLSVWQLDVTPAGDAVVLGASRRPLVDDMYMAQDIHVLPLPPGVPAEDAAPGTPRLLVDPPGKLGNLRVAPDGRHVAYTAAASRADHAPSRVLVVPLDGGGRPRDLTPPDFEGHAELATWRDAETVLYQSAEGVRSTWSLVPITPAGATRTIYDSRETGVVAELPVVRPGLPTALVVGSAPTHPRELYAWTAPGAAPAGLAPLRRLTDSNPWLAERALGRQEVVRYAARDGLAIEGILIHPTSAPKRGRPPLVVDVHGGPESNVSDGWLTGYFQPGQVAAGRGFLVFYPNYRGSTGRGLDFAAASFGDPAGAEFDDIVDAIRHLTGPEGPADPERVGVVGASYGGYAANWFATRHSELVRAVVSFVGVADLVAKRFLTDIPVEDEAVHMGAPVREQWDLMYERSPIRHAAANDTAVLLLHGAGDTRVHPSQAQELYRALKQAGHPAVRLVYYPGEGHGNRLRSFRLDAAVRTLEWITWYVAEEQPVKGPLPPRDLGDRYGLELPSEDTAEE